MQTFLSYVREDSDVAQYVADILKANGVQVWLDVEQIGAGERWRDALHRAIQSGDRFLCLFSRARKDRDRSNAHEELRIAIDELRQRPRDRTWFIAVSIDGTEIPDDRISGGESLRDLQYLDVSALGWLDAMKRLLAAHDVTSPVFTIGEPIAEGLGDRVDIIGGNFRIRNFKPAGMMDAYEGSVFHVEKGHCERLEDGRIAAVFETSAPNEALQTTNKRLGLSSVRAVTLEQVVSRDANRPTTFSFTDHRVIPAGENLSIPGVGSVTLPAPLPIRTSFTAQGHLENDHLIGAFEADWDVSFFGRSFKMFADGDFELAVRSAVRP